MSCSSLRIIVSGVIAQYPLGGMTWHYLQYVLGLARLGHDVYYFEDTGGAPYDPASGSVISDAAVNIRYLADLMEHFGLKERWAYRCGLRDQWFGMRDAQRKELRHSADLLLNVSGMLERPSAYRDVRRLAYIDTDPVFNQIRLATPNRNDLRELVDSHDVHFSFGETLDGREYADERHWLPTRQPIVLDQWRSATPHRNIFTTVMNWSAKKTPPIYAGRTYGQKDIEFLRFIDLPQRVVPTLLEIAVNAGKRRQAPMELLRSSGWHVVDPEKICVDWNSYRNFIESSKAEWSVAKNGYVQGQPGWFSDRSACYLAAGRPVVVQNTGFASVLPVGQGILPFDTFEEAVAAIADVETNYARHARAARDIAETYFNSDKVLARLIADACERESCTAAAARVDGHA
jgi:hypothetical protein